MAQVNPTSIKDISKIFQRVRNAFDSGVTRDIQFRKKQLISLKRFMEENHEAIIDCLAKDLSKPRLECVITEIHGVNSDIKLTLKHLDDWVKPQPVSKCFLTSCDSPALQYSPMGVVLIIGPWNYPINLNIQPMVGAIAAGNSIILKPSECSPHCSNFLAETLPKYLDKECYQIINGGPEIAQKILEYKFDHIFFTGSSTVGRIVYEAAARNLTPVTLELGGKSPTYIDPEIQELEKAVERVIWGKCMNSGQTCIAPDYILTTADIEKKLSEICNKLMIQFYPNGVQNSNDYGRIINQKHFDRLESLLNKTKGTILIGGKTDSKSLFIEPTVVANVDPDDALMSEEIFGPVLPIVRIQNEDEAIEFINKRPKPLVVYVFSDDQAVINKFQNNTSSGALVANDTLVHAVAENLALGGVGESGIGSYHGKMTFETFSYKRSILIRNYMILPDLFSVIRNPPYTDYKATSLAKLLEPTGSIIPGDLWMASKHLANHIGYILRGQSQKLFGR